MPLCLPFRSLFPAHPTISKRTELPESHAATLARHTSDPAVRIYTLAHDAFYHEHRADISSSAHSRDLAAAGHEATGLRFSSHGPDPRFAIALRISQREFLAWTDVFLRGGFRVPPALSEISFTPFWEPVMARRVYGYPCIRTLYCTVDTERQVAFKEMVLWLATVQWLVGTGGVGAAWVRARLLEAVRYLGIPWLGNEERRFDFLSGRLARGATELASKNEGVFESVFGRRRGRVALAGGRRVGCWAEEDEVSGLATCEGGPTGMAEGGAVYLPDVLLTHRPGLWATRTVEDGEFAKAMERWGHVLLVEAREQYYAARGAKMACVAVGRG
jgi:hypothetical protein